MAKQLPEVGDRIFITGGMGGKKTVTKVATKYNQDTGVPYTVVFFDGHGFRFPSGKPWNPPTAYWEDFEEAPK